MARARSGKKKKGAKKRPKKAAAKARAKPAKRTARRRRPPRVKARTGPVQLWLPLQMPLGLLGGVAVAPTAPDGLDEEAPREPTSPSLVVEQSSLFE